MVDSDVVVLVHVVLEGEEDNNKYNIHILYDKYSNFYNVEKYVNSINSVLMQKGETIITLFLDGVDDVISVKHIVKSLEFNLVDVQFSTCKAIYNSSWIVANIDGIVMSFFEIFRTIWSKSSLRGLKDFSLPIHKYESMKDLYAYEDKCVHRVSFSIDDIILSSNVQLYNSKRNVNVNTTKSLSDYANIARSNVKLGTISTRASELLNIIKSCLRMVENRGIIKENIMKILDE